MEIRKQTFCCCSFCQLQTVNAAKLEYYTCYCFHSFFCWCNLETVRVSPWAVLFVSSKAQGRQHLVSGESKMINKVSCMSVTNKVNQDRNRNKIWWPLTFRPPVLLPSAPPWSAAAACPSRLVGTGLPGAVFEENAGAGAGTSFWSSEGSVPSSVGATHIEESYIPEFSDDDEESNASSSSGMSSYRVPT